LIFVVGGVLYCSDTLSPLVESWHTYSGLAGTEASFNKHLQTFQLHVNRKNKGLPGFVGSIVRFNPKFKNNTDQDAQIWHQAVQQASK